MVELNELLGRTRVVLLDFDGPVCAVFGGFKAAAVAEELRTIAIDAGVPRTKELESTDDPLEVWRLASALDPGKAVWLEDELRKLELRAVPSAEPTPGGREFIERCAVTGRSVVIVSNNSAQTVRAYMDENEIAGLIHSVVGRDPVDPKLMKPSPHLVELGIETVSGFIAADYAFIGDSVSDVRAANSAGIASIGYANKPGKAAALTKVGATALVSDMTDLVESLHK